MSSPRSSRRSRYDRPEPVILRADVAEGLAQVGMRATGFDPGKHSQNLATLYTSRIISVRGHIWLAEEMGYFPEQVELDLLDHLTRCAVTAWVASRLLGEDGQAFAPDEVFSTFDLRGGRYPMLTVGLVGARGSMTVDNLGVVAITGRPWQGHVDAIIGIFDHIPANIAGTRHGRALALKAAVEAIAAGTLHR